MENCHILHFSDLHFGKLSLINDSELKYDFQDFKFTLKSKLEELLKEKNIKIVIITGDTGSYGLIDKNRLIKEFFTLFSSKKIPILICVGNHDLERELIKKDQQFNSFCRFLKNYEKDVRIKFSENFENNQTTYYYLPEYNLLLLSINSCVNIEAIPIFRKRWNWWNEVLRIIRRKPHYDESRLNLGIFSIEKLGEILNEISSKIEKYDTSKKFLIMHHPISFLEKRPATKIFLEKNKIFIVFSGHLHNYSYKKDRNLHNFIAGSILVSAKRTKNFIPFTSSPPQFNLYELDFSKNEITPFRYQLDANDGNWIEYKQESISFYLNPEYYSLIQQLESDSTLLTIVFIKLDSIFNDFFNKFDYVINIDQLKDFLIKLDVDNILNDYVNEEDFLQLEEEETIKFFRYAHEKDVIDKTLKNKRIYSSKEILNNAQVGLKLLLQLNIEKIVHNISAIIEDYELDQKYITLESQFGWTYHESEDYIDDDITIYNYKDVEGTNVDVYELKCNGLKIFMYKFYD